MPPESTADDILNTMKELGAEDAFGPSSEIDPPPDSRPDPVAEPAEGDEPKGDERPRDEHGRFVRRDGEQEGTEEEPAKAAEGEDAKPASDDAEDDLEPPHEWSAADQEQFRKLPREGRELVLRQQKAWAERHQPDIQQAQALKQTFEPIAQALAPYTDYFRRSGQHPAQYVTTLIALAEQAQNDPKTFLREQARAHGVDLAELAGGGQRQAEPEDEWVDPAVKAVREEMRAELAKRDEIIQRLGGGLNGYEQQQQMAAQQRLASTIQQFVSAADESGKPKHPYFEEVRQHMGALLNAGAAPDLETAYDMAVHANPETRAKLAAAERSAAERRAAREAREKAEQAKRAGGSVVGEGAAGPSAPQIPTNSTLETAMAVARQAGWQL